MKQRAENGAPSQSINRKLRHVAHGNISHYYHHFFFVAVINHYHLIRAYSSIGNSVPGLGSLFDSQIGFLSVSLARTRRETGKEKERMIWRDVYPIHTVWNGGERERKRERKEQVESKKKCINSMWRGCLFRCQEFSLVKAFIIDITKQICLEIASRSSVL